MRSRYRKRLQEMFHGFSRMLRTGTLQQIISSKHNYEQIRIWREGNGGSRNYASIHAFVYNRPAVLRCEKIRPSGVCGISSSPISAGIVSVSVRIAKTDYYRIVHLLSIEITVSVYICNLTVSQNQILLKRSRKYMVNPPVELPYVGLDKP